DGKNLVIQGHSTGGRLFRVITGGGNTDREGLGFDQGGINVCDREQYRPARKTELHQADVDDVQIVQHRIHRCFIRCMRVGFEQLVFDGQSCLSMEPELSRIKRTLGCTPGLPEPPKKISVSSARAERPASVAIVKTRKPLLNLLSL